MKLTDEQFNNIVAKITEKAGLFKCPVCGKNEKFSLITQQQRLFSFDVIPIVCPVCGYIMFFDIDTLERDDTIKKNI